MKKFLTLCMMLCVASFAMTQTITGMVVDADTKDPLIGASVLVKGTTTGTVTDLDGKFSLNLSADAKSAVISYTGYESMTVDLAGRSNLGTIALATAAYGLDAVVITGTMDIVQDRRTPVAVSTIGMAEIQAKSVGNVEFPEVMKNTPSVYVSNQTGFGDSQMFMRGFDQINTAFLLNGQPINGMEDGRMYWSNWSGMSDVASAVQVQRGLGSSNLAISSVGGTVNIVTRTVENQKGGFARAMVGNDGYLKGSFSYNTGLSQKGWAFSVLLDHWQAENKWAEGTRGQGQNYFVSVGYKPNERNVFNFLVTGAPQWHGQRWSQSLETLEETPKFNQHWGEYDGEWESERRNFYHKPIINLSWDHEISETSSLASVVYASFGRGGGTGDLGRGRVRTESGQVDFDAIEADNLADSDGLGSFSDNYAIRASMNNHQWYGNVTKFETELNSNLSWSVGADMRWYRGDHFRQLSNLLGLDGWQDNFLHATRSSDAIQSDAFNPSPWTALFNFADEDQRVAYDYSENINYQGAFTQLEYSVEQFTAFIQSALSNQSYQREGRWADQGQSEKISKVGYNVKGGASFSPTSTSTIFANAGLYSRQPFLDNIFENIRYSNEFITDGDGETLGNEEIVGLELGYKLQTADYTLNINAYRSSWDNRSNVSLTVNDNGTPDDESDDFNQRIVERGIGQIHTGVELDGSYRVSDFRIRAHASYGDWVFDGIDNVQIFNDDTGLLMSETKGLDNAGVHVPNAPQTSAGLGLQYNNAGFSIYVDYNYYDRLYQNNINFNSSDQFLTEDIDTLDPYGLLDAGVAYKWNMNSGNLMTFRGNVYNVLSNDYINQTDAFGFYNGNGTTWNFSLKYSF